MNTRSITVFGDGSVHAQPEQVEIQFKTNGSGTHPTEAYQTVADQTATLKHSLAEDGCDQSQLKTVDCTVSHRSNQFDSTPDDPPYSATETLVVTCRDKHVRNHLLAGLEAGADVIEIRPAVIDKRRTELRSAAFADAVNDARAHAEAIAAAECVELGAVLDVSETDPSGMDSLVDEALAHTSTDTIEPRPIELSARVSVCYEIEPP